MSPLTVEPYPSSEVDSSRADAFTLTLSPAAAGAETKTPEGSILPENDVREGPIYAGDKNGRIIRVIRR